MTFCETDGLEKAIDMKRSETKLLGQHIRFNQACEPNNVQWENKEIKDTDVQSNLVRSLYLLILIAIIGFFGIGDLSQNAISALMLYPSNGCHLIFKSIDEKKILDVSGSQYLAAH